MSKGKPAYTLREAAHDNMLVCLSCRHCIVQNAIFLATDLVQILDPERDARAAPFACSLCKKTEYVRVRLRAVENGDVGITMVRRLVRIKMVPLWRYMPL
jgi:hypothetical protein